jgi:hypothetical protein
MPHGYAGKSALLPDESVLGAMTLRSCKPIRRQVTLQPDEADAVIHQFGDRESKSYRHDTTLCMVVTHIRKRCGVFTLINRVHPD